MINDSLSQFLMYSNDVFLLYSMGGWQRWWMVNLAMGSLRFLSIFLIFWHSWDPWICIHSVCWKWNLKQIEAIHSSLFFLANFHALSLFKTLHLFFLTNLPGLVFIPCLTSIPHSRVKIRAFLIRELSQPPLLKSVLFMERRHGTTLIVSRLSWIFF